MTAPFQECQGCVATPFCKAYSGEAKLSLLTWCRPKLRLDRALDLAEIPKKYRNANMYNFQVDPYNSHIFDEVKPYLDDIEATVATGKNFFFYGHKTGTGKTYTAMCLLNQFIYKTCQTVFDFENPLALYVVYSDLAHDMKFGQFDDQVQARFDTLRKVPLLLLDDIGTGNMTDTVRDHTFRLINSRVNDGLSTIVTTNYTTKELDQDQKLGSRTVSRLFEDAVGLELVGKDRRKLR
ncbi:ATP-binding protein (plasmid) [Paenibacillus sp. S-38]|uniref:ATP-binding protein n=1 Tax=Paenibacillus sp. S-38 TaxID=3416710 RepID=UPI003CF65121